MLLEQKDITADSKDIDGRTPFSFAAERGHEVIIKMLEDVAPDSKDSIG